MLLYPTDALYNGIPKDPVTVLEGITNKLTPYTKIIF